MQSHARESASVRHTEDQRHLDERKKAREQQKPKRKSDTLNKRDNPQRRIYEPVAKVPFPNSSSKTSDREVEFRRANDT